ncbi:Hypothetical predicted protein [Cloeon dipterum]|nr:Hypothetical predicted protein [Cloeon dipterum]
MVPVCTNNFANTFGVSKRTIQSWISLKTGKERSAETPTQKKTGVLRANRNRKLINPSERNLGGPFFLIEWIESKKKHIAKASEIWCLEKTNPTFEHKKYNVLYSEAGGKKLYKSAIILKGPGSFQEVNSWLKEKDDNIGGKRPRRMKRLPPKSLEFASEDAADNNPAKKTKRGPKTAQTPWDIFDNINMPTSVEDNALAGDRSTQETPEVHLEIHQSEAREWDLSGLAFSAVKIQPPKKAVGKKKSREMVLAKKDEDESRTLLDTACDQLAIQMRKPEEEKQMSKTDGVGEIKSSERVSAKKGEHETRTLLKTARDQLASQKKDLEEEKQMSQKSDDDNHDVSIKLLMDLHKKVDKILEMMAKNNPDTTSLGEPPLLQVLNDRWVYIGRGYVLSRKRYSNSVVYACSDVRKFVSQITKAIFGKELLSQSRLAPNGRSIKPEGQKLTFLEPALLDAIFMTQERFSQDGNITPLAMSQIRGIASYLCGRMSDVKCPWSTPGFKKLSQIKPDDDEDDEDPQETSDQGEAEEEVSIEREEYYVDEDQYHNLNSDEDKHEEEVVEEENAEEEIEAEETDFEDNKKNTVFNREKWMSLRSG